MSDSLSTIARLLVRHSDAPGRNPGEIQADDPVFGAGGVISDSLNILDALTAIEKEFQIHIPDEELTEELFSSVKSLSEYVDKQRAVA